MLSINEFIEQKNYNIERLYIDRFYSSIENDKWIYIDNEMLKWFGYSHDRDRDNKKYYIELLKNNFIENDEFKMISSAELNNYIGDVYVAPLTNTINTYKTTKHLILEPECFKKSLMLMRTEKAKEIRNYYIELEKIFKHYLKYQNEYNRQELIESQQELIEYKQESQQQLEEKENIIQEQKKELAYKTGILIEKGKLINEKYIYVATSKNYFKSNIFKIGRTNNIKTRLKGYATGRINDDKFHYIFVMKCYDDVALEHLIQSKLKQFQFKEQNNNYNNELFQLDYNVLLNIMKNFEKIDNKNTLFINQQLANNSNNNIINTQNINEVIIQDIYDYVNKKFDLNLKEEDSYERFKDWTSTPRGDKNKINEEIKQYNFQLMEEYKSYEEHHKFQCLSIFKHNFSWTIDYMNTVKTEGCPDCRAFNILRNIDIYKYEDKTYNFIQSYKNFDEIKNEDSEINIQLLKNIIREKRWLTPHKGYIYSILSPFNNKLDLTKKLNEKELKLIEILEIDYEEMKNKILLAICQYIYGIDDKNKIIYRANNYTAFSNKLKYVDAKRNLNRKTIPKYINNPNKYAGYLWSTNININNYPNYTLTIL